MSKEYPQDYKGPKAGHSTDEEWVAVRDFDAFKYVRDFTWTYCDFDCWLVSRYKWHYNRGNDEAVKALKEMQKIIGIKSN